MEDPFRACIHGLKTRMDIFEEAEKAFKVCAYFDPAKTDELGTIFSLVKFRSALRRWMSG
jgi:hypothetical protein